MTKLTDFDAFMQVFLMFTNRKRSNRSLYTHKVRDIFNQLIGQYIFYPFKKKKQKQKTVLIKLSYPIYQ